MAFNPQGRRASVASFFLKLSPGPPKYPTSLLQLGSWCQDAEQRKGEDSGIRTVQLARGTVPESRLASDSRTFLGRKSVERSSIPRSEVVETGDTLQILNQTCITELLEGDDRPTFIVDLGESALPIPGTLGILWANSALRANSSLLDMVVGCSMEHLQNYEVAESFPQFKPWLMSLPMLEIQARQR